MKNKVYVAIAPWDSYSVGLLEVFKTKANAERRVNEYNRDRSPYAADANVQECDII